MDSAGVVTTMRVFLLVTHMWGIYTEKVEVNLNTASYSLVLIRRLSEVPTESIFSKILAASDFEDSPKAFMQSFNAEYIHRIHR